jgi:putative DNA primase/helicase
MTSTMKAPRAKPSRNGTHRPIHRVLDGVRRIGLKVQESGEGQWRSQCPCHKGKSLNLSIKECDDGTVLLRCHHQANGQDTCSPRAIMAELGLKPKDLFPELKARSPSKPPKSGHAPSKKPPPRKHHPTPEAAIAVVVRELGQPSAFWVYNDADGFELMRVYRFDLADGKKQCRPVHPHKDGWSLGDPPGKLPLYRLDELAAADQVFVLEGEKCSDLVRNLGIRNLGMAATTSAHGYASAAKSDWGPLRGKRVILIPDHDQPGEKYIEDVAAELSKLEPKPDLKILRLPLTTEGDDVEQWLESCPDGWGLEDCRAELLRLAAERPAALEPGRDGTAGPPAGPTDGGGDGSDGSLARLPQTDTGNAERLVARSGDRIRHCHRWKKWLHFDGRRWVLDDPATIHQLAKRAIRKILAEASTIEDDQARKALVKWARTSEARERLNATIALAAMEEGIPIRPEALDTDPWLLNCLNGTIDLRRGILFPHRREDFLTMMSPVEFDATARCPLWDSVLWKVFDGNEDLIGFWDRLCGICLTGTVHEQILPILWGQGSNGKSTLVKTLVNLLGPDFAILAPPGLVQVKRGDAHPTERAILHGKRLVVEMETADGVRLNEALIKLLTGGDRITCRRMGEDFWDFDPTHKLFLCTNHKPEVRGTDHAIWRRPKLIPFTVTIPDSEAITDLPDQLRAEYPGILARCVRACLDWQRNGLQVPKEVTEATQQYKDEQDTLAGFLAEECQIADPRLDQPRTKATPLYERYRQRAQRLGEDPMSLTSFGKAMKEKGFQKKESHGMWYLGIGLHQSDSSKSKRAEDEYAE